MRNWTGAFVFLWVGLGTACSSSGDDSGASGDTPDPNGAAGDVNAGGSAPTTGAAGASVSGVGGAMGTGGSDVSGTGGKGGTAPGTGGSAGKGGSSGSNAGNGGGGASGGSGAAPDGGGNIGGPPHVVADCNGLASVGEWESITPPGVGSVLNIVVDPVHAGTVFAGTANKGIYRSTNCGKDWIKIDTGAGSAAIDSGGQWSMAIDPKNPNVLFAGSLYGSDPSLLKSTNGGVDWKSTAPPGSEIAMTVDYNFLQEVSMDPTDPAHLVLSFHANCKGAYAPMCMAESKDSGETWRLFKGPTNSWGENARPLVMGATTWLYVTWADGVYYTKDSGATWEKLAALPGANHQIFLASSGTYYLGTYKGVFKSADGHAWTALDGSPGGADGLNSDGTRIFTGMRDSAQNQLPFFAAPAAGATPWTSLPSPTMAHGPVKLDYEADHHILYSANTDSGAWRMVTK
jgi:hypothetical protein